MTTTTTTGQLNQTSTGRTYITGTASGLDTNTLITSAVAKITAKATTLTDQVTTNTQKISSYQGLQTEINSLEAALNALKSTTNATGSTASTTTTDSAFDSKGVAYTTSDGSAGSNYLSVTASGTATNGDHTVIVSQLAQAERVTGSSVTSKTTALGYSGSFSLNIGSTAATSITVTADMSLQDIVNAVNAQSTTSGVSADILQVSNGSYELVLNGTSTNQTITATDNSGGILSGLGITDSSGAFTSISQKAQPASIIFDGTTITSDTNTFSNLLTGVDLTVSAASSATINLSITNNTSGVKSALQSIITAYNTLYDGIASEQKVNSDGSIPTSEYLYGDSIVSSVGQIMQSLITSLGNNTSSVNSLGSIGITLNSDNHLEISDETTLDDTLANNFSDIEALFATQTTTSNSALGVVQNSSNLNSAFTVAITVDSSGAITGADVGGDSDAFTVTGNQIIGKTGTVYAGLILSFSGTSSTSITVTPKTGIADSLVNALDAYANDDTGVIASQITQLQTKDTTLTAQATAIQKQAASYQDTLITKYANMEAKIEAAQLLEKQIIAVMSVTTDSSS